MTVKELIEILQTLPEDAVLYLAHSEWVLNRIEQRPDQKVILK